MGTAERTITIVLGILRRLRQSKEVRRADIIWIHRFAAPVGTGLVASYVKALKRPLIFGYDDAVYVKQGKPNRLRDWLGSWRDVSVAVSKSDAVLAWNRELQAHAQQYGKEVCLLPAAIDTAHYIRVKERTRAHEDDATFRVGWIGTPASAPYLDLVHAVLSILAQEGPLEVRLIGGDMADVPGATMRRIRWQQETEVEELCEVDVGIAPMVNNAWTRGKSGLKVVQYMGCGLPVVASAVGAHLDLVQDGVQGFLVDSQEAWLGALRSLRDNRSLRLRMGQAGFETTKTNHDFSVVARAVADVCKQLV
jgi:glycosyltransferase involved in cell wall biosynthesis